MNNTVHNPNSEKWETLANNVKYHLRSDFHLSDDEIPEKEIHSIPEMLIYLTRYDETEYAEGEGIHGTIFNEVTPSNKVYWKKKKSCDDSIININDMIELLNEAKQKYGEDARLAFHSHYDDNSDYYTGRSDEYTYEVDVVHDVPETWESYYDRLKKFRDELEQKTNKKAIEDALIKEFAPDITISMLSESERLELLLSIYRIKAIGKSKNEE